MQSRASLADDFRRLGVCAGDAVVLHASIRSVGRIIGGPDQIHLALKNALTPAAGTLLMYASCPEFHDEVGRGNLTADEERRARAFAALCRVRGSLTVRQWRPGGRA
jgi:aminoglycoside 3-N-acetyltransferase